MSKKLIRLHTTDSESIFECVFNEEIKVNPYSEICLHSCSFPIENRYLVVDSTNDTLTFQTMATSVRTIRVPHGTYSKYNSTRLLETITDRMNQSLSTTKTKEHGTEISVHINKENKVAFDFGYENQMVVSTTGDDNLHFFKADTITVAGRNANISLAAGNESPNNDKGYIVGNKPFTRGCGSFKYDLTYYQPSDDNTTVDIAITFGLIPQEIWDIYKAANGAPVDAADIVNVASNKWKYANTIARVGLPSSMIQGDQIAMELTDGKINFTQYKADNSTVQLSSFNFDYQNLGTTNYYPCIIFHQESQYLRAQKIKWTPTPYNTNDLTNTEVDFETLSSVLPSPNGRPSIYKITFGSITQRDFFGYDELTLNPLSHTTPNRSGANAFVASKHFSNTNSSDNYIIEMLNLKLDSYDSFSKNGNGGGRKNILAPIPITEQIIDQQTGLVIYEPNNFNFISLNNEYTLNLRNIRMRILDFQFGTVFNSGFASVNIIIRDSDRNKRE